MRVLIVEDQPLTQTALANVLSTRSDVEHFDSFSDAINALEKLATDSYDVLLLDIDLAFGIRDESQIGPALEQQSTPIAAPPATSLT